METVHMHNSFLFVRWQHSPKRPSSLHETIKNCADQNGSFITPPSTESMTNFMREKKISDASFLTPVQRYNSTHYSDGGTLRKLSDLGSTNLLSMNNTCMDKGEDRSIFTKPMLYWGENFYVASEGKGFPEIICLMNGDFCSCDLSASESKL